MPMPLEKLSCQPCEGSNPASCLRKGLQFLGDYEKTEFVTETKLPTEHGDIRFRAYRTTGSESEIEPIVIVSGNIGQQSSTGVPLSVHDQCVTSEVFGSLKCDCRKTVGASSTCSRGAVASAWPTRWPHTTCKSETWTR